MVSGGGRDDDHGFDVGVGNGSVSAGAAIQCTGRVAASSKCVGSTSGATGPAGGLVIARSELVGGRLADAGGLLPHSSTADIIARMLPNRSVRSRRRAVAMISRRSAGQSGQCLSIGVGDSIRIFAINTFTLGDSKGSRPVSIS
jgi:hypothetical protein